MKEIVSKVENQAPQRNFATGGFESSIARNAIFDVRAYRQSIIFS